MLSKASHIVSRSGIKSFRGFGTLKKNFLELLNRDDKSDPFYIGSTYNPLLPLEGHKPILRENLRPTHNITKLSNGITVLTESQVFPSQVDFGILLDLGTRDETTETSGALLSIKNTYYKTVLNTNETINYGMVQMSGGEFTMDYDQENTYWRASCLPHDVVDLFRMVSDCAFEPRSVVAANVGIDKNSHTHKIYHSLNTGEDFNDYIFKTAYGLRGVGLPLKGLSGNVKNLSAFVLQKFQYEHINPERVYVCAAGIENHEEFVELVQSKLGAIPKPEGNLATRERSEYIGGETRNLTDSNEINLALVFESANWASKDIFALNVLNTILGSSSSFSTGGPGKGMHARTTTNLLNKHYYIDSANSLNFHFSDTGLFGLQVSGPADHGTKLLHNLTSELKGLTHKIDESELTRAKNLLKSNILLALERQGDRIEEAVKNLKTFNQLNINEYIQNVDNVTSDQINSIVAKLLSSRPTFVAEGGELNRLPTLDAIQNLLKL